ncbi:hypothetical protein HG263_07275 [Pseudoalteromonas sp. JBTF-M23]|uniref:Uncharacterized protein n=1 Tax=Pseudoalteromonas caenipelagi TaxID=2726988 RepID=A0A849VCQ8_9GAMM|nr:hypothetical protein [Pseudoalteromonas caenipelagi]NOU50343.1 hypothetical protein [Pseudoalteromonas caenipelagi]
MAHNGDVVTFSISNDGISLNIKAFSRSNSVLLQVKITKRVCEIALLGKFAYVQLRLLNNTQSQQGISNSACWFIKHNSKVTQHSLAVTPKLYSLSYDWHLNWQS